MPAISTPPTERKNRLGAAWELLTQAGLAEITLRLGTHVLLIALILLVAWGLRALYLNPAQADAGAGGALAGSNRPARPGDTLDLEPAAALPALDAVGAGRAAGPVGIVRQARLHTDAPVEGRREVLVYTTKPGDTLLGLAEKFNLAPASLLWANQPTLSDNPHNLHPDQQLNILPLDGAYHRWSAGDVLENVADFYHVAPEAIAGFPANQLQNGQPAVPGTWLVIPGGRRGFVGWSVPAIPLDKPEVAKVLGSGACETLPPGAVGTGSFIWPGEAHYLSGLDYLPEANHPGIDIAGEKDSPVLAADHGVVVYAGWNSWGYGNVVVINHGNGWQTLYAHLNAYYVACGASVRQGAAIGGMGEIGDASGFHLHFEMMYSGALVNPHDYVR